jgi:tryptophan halogenase
MGETSVSASTLEQHPAGAPYRITIAGGGTAGWMTAAALSHFLDPAHFAITLIESDEIGTVGVGEATIPQIQLFNQALGIDEDAFLAATQGSYKLGIEFVGWREPGHRYMHAFGAIGRDVGLVPFQHYWRRALELGFAKPLAHYSLNEMAARAGRMHRGGPITARTIPAMPYAFHFDASLYAAYLRRYAEARRVRRIEGRIAEVDRQGADVRALSLASGERIEADLFIDCTGFRALLIDSDYEDWSHWLPCDRAIALPCATGGSFTPYTRATAHAAGWQWRIPLRHRTGNGHVFSSRHMSEDEATAILLANLDGAPMGEPRALRFIAGKRRAAWAGNVVAIGLSSGFLEPLESTSIFLIQSAIQRLFKLLPGRNIRPADRAEYNRQTDFEIERIRDFIILHYKLNERPEPFWAEMRAMAVPETLQAKLDLFAASGHITREHEELFTEVGWLQVMVGQGLLPEGYHALAGATPARDLAQYLDTIETLYAREVERMPSHAEFLARHKEVAA